MQCGRSKSQHETNKVMSVLSQRRDTFYYILTATFTKNYPKEGEGYSRVHS